MDAITDTNAAIQNADIQARIDLASVYRLLVMHGWGDVIFNHAAMRLPSNPRRFLIKRHELLEATDAALLAHVCEHVAAQYEKHDEGRASAEWPAYLRQLDQADPGYRD